MSGQTRRWEGGRFEGRKDFPGPAPVIYGHSHHPHLERKNVVLYLNPGSAGPRRFTRPVTLARIKVDNQTLCPELVELKV